MPDPQELINDFYWAAKMLQHACKIMLVWTKIL